MEMTAALVMPYTPWSGAARRPATLVTLMMEPGALRARQVVHDLARHAEVALEVHLERLAERAPVAAHHGPEVRVGGRVVHQHVHLAEVRHRAGHELGAALVLAHVRRDHERVAARRADLRGHLVQALLLAGGQDHLRARRRQLRGDGRADAAAGSRDDGDLPSQPLGPCFRAHAALIPPLGAVACELFVGTQQPRHVLAQRVGGRLGQRAQGPAAW
jgi:hypothetical protein